MKSPTAFDDLFTVEYRRLVRALAVAFGEAAAADAVQEAFIAAEVRWRRVSRMQDPAGWVRRVAVNRLLNRRRDDNRRSEILESAPTGIGPDGVDPATSLDLRAAISELPPRMRAAVLLHYVADLSIDEVADAMGTRPGTVKSTLHDARSKMRTALEETRHV